MGTSFLHPNRYRPKADRLRLDLGEFNEDVQRVLAAIIAARGSTS